MTSRIKRMSTGSVSPTSIEATGQDKPGPISLAQASRATHIKKTPALFRLFTEKMPLIIIKRNVDRIRLKDGSYGAPIHRGMPRAMVKEFERKRARAAAGRWAN